MRGSRLIGALGAAAVLASSATPARAEVIEVGATVGRTSTSMLQTYDCPPPDSPSDVCAISGESHENRRGLAAGVYARYPLARAVLLQAQLQYAQKGYELTQPTLHVDYLELPLLLRLDPVRAVAPVRPFFQVGLAPALRVHCRDSGETVVEQAPLRAEHYNIACGDEYGFHMSRSPARFDLSYVFGIGLGWDSPLGLVEIEARLTNGLVDNEAWGPGGPTKNRGGYVLVGFGRPFAM